MVEIRASLPEEIPAQRRLWKLAFGDEDAYIDYFYKNHYRPERVLVLAEEGKLASMLALFPMDLSGPGGVCAKAGYVYALATDPAVRKKGYGRKLLQELEAYLRHRGVDCVTVVPAQPSLHKFFRTVGYDECFATRQIELGREEAGRAGAEDSVASIEPGAYNCIRESLLAGTHHIAYSDTVIQYQQGLSQMAGAGLYRLSVEGVEGCCAAEYDGDSLVVKELLIPEKQLAGAAALIADRLPARHYHIRTPAFWQGLPGGYVQPFGMVQWYNREKEADWGYGRAAYMGFGFD